MCFCPTMLHCTHWPLPLGDINLPPPSPLLSLSPPSPSFPNKNKLHEKRHAGMHDRVVAWPSESLKTGQAIIKGSCQAQDDL